MSEVFEGESESEEEWGGLVNPQYEVMRSSELYHSRV